MIKTALIGYGLSARVFHLPFLTASASYAVTAISSSQGDKIRADFPSVQVYDSPEALIRRCDADLVVITAPNHVHYELAASALSHGRDVLLEKPFVTLSSQGEKLIELAERYQRLLCVYHNRRRDGDFLTLRELIDSDRVGRVRYFKSHIDRFNPTVRERWREQPGPGAGMLYDLGPHLIDQMLCLFGPPDAVTGHCHALREGSEVDDFFHVVCHYPQRLVELQSSPFHAGPMVRYELQGDRGRYVKLGMDPQEERLRAGHPPGHPDRAKPTSEQDGMLYTETDAIRVPTVTGGYQHFYARLASAIENRDQPPVTPAEALQGIRLIELILESSRTGRTMDVAR